MTREKHSPNKNEHEDAVRKLWDIAGNGKRDAQIYNAQQALGWLFPSAPNRIRKYLHRERRPAEDDIPLIKVAHVRTAPARIAKLDQALRRQLDELASFIAWAQRTDPDFYAHDIALAQSQINSFRHLAGGRGDEAQ